MDDKWQIDSEMSEEVKRCERYLADARRRLQEHRLANCGIKIGDIIRIDGATAGRGGFKPQRAMVTDINTEFISESAPLPALLGHYEKQDGGWSKQEISLFRWNGKPPIGHVEAAPAEQAEGLQEAPQGAGPIQESALLGRGPKPPIGDVEEAPQSAGPLHNPGEKQSAPEGAGPLAGPVKNG